MKELQIRYVKLHFVLEIVEDTIMPTHKASAIRGGVGEMLLRANCISNRDCEKCGFESECIVQRTMYSKFDMKPKLLSGTMDSVGYVIECEDYHEDFSAGDTLEFNLLLFGKTIVYFNQYIQAVYALGQHGIGKNKSRYQVAQVLNTKREPILDGNNIYMKYYRHETIEDYVNYRLKQIEKNGIENVIVFQTPLTQKHNNSIMSEFDMDVILKSIQRRIYILDAFEQIDGENAYLKDLPTVKVLEQTTRTISVKRYSNRRKQEMYLTGIKGDIVCESIPEESLKWLLAGEITHIGKNTSFGFGRYRVK